jgi:hypothetical protein
MKDSYPLQCMDLILDTLAKLVWWLSLEWVLANISAQV